MDTSLKNNNRGGGRDNNNIDHHRPNDNNSTNKRRLLESAGIGTAAGALIGAHKIMNSSRNLKLGNTDAARASYAAISSKLDLENAKSIADSLEKKGFTLGDKNRNNLINSLYKDFYKRNDFEEGRLKGIFPSSKVNDPKLAKEFLGNVKRSGITTNKSWAPGALGIGTSAALGSYYLANRDKRWRDKDGKIDKRKAAKDLGKAGLAGVGMYGAGKLTDHLIRRNTLDKLRLHTEGIGRSDFSKGIPIGHITGGFDRIYKNHNRNVALGMGGLALAGVGGYALHRYLKKKKENRQREGEDRQK